jgi:regulator of replication initiation timing
MKKYLSLIVFLAIGQVLLAQTKAELQQRLVTLVDEKMALQEEQIKFKTEILELKEQIVDLKNENQTLRNEVERLKATQGSAAAMPVGASQAGTTQKQNLTSSTSSTPGRCQAITAKGTQCSRSADPGSNYCWQHKSTYEPSGSTKSSVSSSSSSSSSSSGRTIYTGPRGGKYYINSKGNKVYVKN